LKSCYTISKRPLLLQGDFSVTENVVHAGAGMPQHVWMVGITPEITGKNIDWNWFRLYQSALCFIRSARRFAGLLVCLCRVELNWFAQVKNWKRDTVAKIYLLVIGITD
jgi:hypothetical protein